MAVGGAKPQVVSDKLSASHYLQPDPKAAGGTLVEIETPPSLSDEAAEVWQLIVPPLLKAGILREDDLVLLVGCSEAWAAAEYFNARMWELIGKQRKLEADIDKGLISTDELVVQLATIEVYDGQIKRARTAWLQAQRSAQSLSADLGLGPVARVRLGLAKVQGNSLLEMLRQIAPGGAPT